MNSHVPTAKAQTVAMAGVPLRALSVPTPGLALVLSQIGLAYGRGAPEASPIWPNRCSPAVVNITTSTTVAAPTGPWPHRSRGSPFEDFFRDFRHWTPGHRARAGPTRLGPGSSSRPTGSS